MNCLGYNKLPFHERNDIGEESEMEMGLLCWKEQSDSELIFTRLRKIAKNDY